MEQMQPPPPSAAEKKALQPHGKNVAWMRPQPPTDEPMATELPATELPMEDEIEYIEPVAPSITQTETSAKTDTIRSETASTVSVQPRAPGAAYATEGSKNKRCQCPVCPFFGTHLQGTSLPNIPILTPPRENKSLLCTAMTN